MKYNYMCILIARCYSWGKSWQRHWYDNDKESEHFEICHRCGISRKEAKNQ